MKRNMDLLRRTCREAAALIIAREDRLLSLPDHVALKLHLLACKACPKFENQVLTMRAAMEQWRHQGRTAAQASVVNLSEQSPE